MFSLCSTAALATESSTRPAILSGHQEYAPFMWRNGDHIEGMAVNVMREVLSRLGVDSHSRYVGPWKRAQKALAEGEIDVICAAYITDERKAYSDFTSVPIHADPTKVFVRADKTFPFKEWDDLKGKNFVEIYGESQGQDFDHWRLANAYIHYVTRRIESYKLLESGRVDALVSSYYSTSNAIKKLGFADKFIALDQPVMTLYLYAQISKKSPYVKLLPEINAELQKMTDDGTLEKMLETAQKNYNEQMNLPE
ncbi:substrate-binding periplasmic protein [Pokkaliibacter sp. CJK22405]|uniref:substrate-binding periplasmic protein n=1 Tax=Pokkaliibacter sp. CJK22405 TaxID=3384615 RepID=UPI003984CB3D